MIVLKSLPCDDDTHLTYIDCFLDRLGLVASVVKPNKQIRRNRKEKRSKSFYPDMQCSFTASLSCPHEHESEGNLVPIFIGRPCGEC